ncbi:MAG: site-specific integrase, partial [Oscillospiraceae bacterium]
MGKKKADEMLFWTKDEFQTFIESMKDRKPASYTVFMTMYYTGIREESCWHSHQSDIDFEKKTLTVNKSYQRLGKEDIITTPKTPRKHPYYPYSRRPLHCLREYMSHCYGLQRTTGSFLHQELSVPQKWSMAA